jgi:hypothetical protein
MSDRRRTHVKRLIPLGAAAAALALAPSASAAVDLDGRATTLTLSKGTAAALTSLGVEVAPTGAARAEGRRVTFPISGGAIDPRTAAGRIEHRGGLRLSAGGKSITLRDYVVRVGKRIRLSAEVGGDRVTILNLTGTPRVARRGFNMQVRGLTARLTRPAAQALNRTFGVHAFTRGLALGGVRVAAVPSEIELRRTGATSVALDAGTVQALVGLGVTPGIIGPATLEGTTAAFPITGGGVSLDFGGGHVGHSGGISLTAGSTVVRLERFDIRLGATPQLFASVNGGSPKVAILDLDLSAPAVEVSGRRITVGNVPLKLTQGAADALNAAFGTSALSAGLVLGVPRGPGAGARPLPLPLRSTNTRSIRPYSTASSGVKKRSRSRSSRTCSTGRPVCSA